MQLYFPQKNKNMSLPVYNPDRTFLVDSNSANNTFLIRGNQPLCADGVTFAYNELNAKLQTILPGTGDPSPIFNLSNYTLIDISIIDDNPASERPVLEAEFACFGITSSEFDTNFPWPASWPPYLDPNLSNKLTNLYGTSVTVGTNSYSASVVWYPVQGCTSGSCPDVEVRQFNFNGLVDYLRKLVTTGSFLVIYFHCEHGHDRTSAVTGGYQMKYMGISEQDVLTLPPPNGAKAFKHDWEANYKTLVEYYAGTLTASVSSASASK